MATLTIRNLPVRVVSALKKLAKAHHRSMEQEARIILEEQVADRLAAIKAIEAGWERQARCPSQAEIDRWIRESRP